jgi:chitinase
MGASFPHLRSQWRTSRMSRHFLTLIALVTTNIKRIILLCSHILYAFANVRANTGEVFLSDLWADQDIHYPGDSWSDSGTNLYGNFKAIYQLKKQHRHLKLLLSIGGWTYSPSFHPVVVSPACRAEFVRSAVKLVEDYGLDGLDVDYEYPQNDAQARGYVELLRCLRAALDDYARRKNANYRFLLTVSARITSRGVLPL